MNGNANLNANNLTPQNVADWRNKLEFEKTNELSMSPSDNLTTITLTGSGMLYKAPSNGYVYLQATSNASNGRTHLLLYDKTNTVVLLVVSLYTASGNLLRSFMPVSKGQYVKLEYPNTKNQSARFVSAQTL